MATVEGAGCLSDSQATNSLMSLTLTGEKDPDFVPLKSQKICQPVGKFVGYFMKMPMTTDVEFHILP